MSRERRTATFAAIVLVAAGLLIGWQVLPSPVGISPPPFRQWLWEHRSLDLLVQVGLIFAGALGIAALLPRGKEEEMEE